MRQWSGLMCLTGTPPVIVQPSRARHAVPTLLVRPPSRESALPLRQLPALPADSDIHEVRNTFAPFRRSEAGADDRRRLVSDAAPPTLNEAVPPPLQQLQQRHPTQDPGQSRPSVHISTACSVGPSSPRGFRHGTPHLEAGLLPASSSRLDASRYLAMLCLQFRPHTL